MKNNQQIPTTSTHFDPYCPENIPLFEALYGENLISLGGTTAIDHMLSGLDVTGLNALDLGFGLGGVAFYLAKNYSMKITGIEVYTWMVEHAKIHQPKDLTDSLSFDTYLADGTFPFHAQTFDLVYSKGVLNHVANKNALFHQVNHVLKPHGLFVIADWIFPETTTDVSPALVCETKTSYQKVLSDNGFDTITFRDDSQEFLAYAHQILANLTKHQILIEQQYDKSLFSIIWQQHEELIQKINQHQKYAVRIVAKKR